MSARAMRLKGRIKNYAKSNNVAAQVVLQNYMFERFLERLSKSEYCQRFAIKGGMLIAAIVGLDTRATMDLEKYYSSAAVCNSKLNIIWRENTIYRINRLIISIYCAMV